MRHVPPTWCATTVAEIADPLRYGYTASATPEAAGPRMLRITDIQNGQVDWARVPRCEIAPDKQGHFLLSPGDIVFARTGGTVGKSFLIREVPEPAVFASYLIKVAPTRGVEPRYLYWFFQSLDYWEQIALKKGGLQGNVNAKTLGSIELPIAPTNEQRRIVERVEALFDEIDRGIVSLRTARRMIDLYRQSLLKSAFEGRLTADWRAENPDKLESPDALLARIREEREGSHKSALYDWRRAVDEWGKCGSKGRKPAKPKPREEFGLLRTSDQLPWPRVRVRALLDAPLVNGRSVKDKVGGFPVLRLTALKNGKIDLHEFKEGNWSNDDPRPFLVSRDDIFVARGNGSKKLVGIGGRVLDDPLPIAFPDTMIRVRLDTSAIRPDYFLFSWNSWTVRQQIETAARTTAGIYKINQGHVSEFVLPLPSLMEQAEIVRTLDARLGAAEVLSVEIESSLERAESLRQSILKQAFSGQLVLQDSTDEPASVLVSRLRAQRAKTPTRGHKRRAEP